MNSVIHFEIPADDLMRVKNFYQEAFNWDLQDMPEMKYIIARTTEVDENRMPKTTGAINGGMMKKSDTVKAPSLTIGVENIEEAMEKVKKAGGTLIGEKLTVGDMGIMHYFQDSEGNVMSIWEAIKK